MESYVAKTERYSDVIIRIRACKDCGRTYRTDEEVTKMKER